MNNDITEQYLNQTWENFSKEQMRLMGDIKSGKEESELQTIQKQLTQINAIMMGLMRLRNIKKKASSNF
jgi:Tfp pilus assembly protein PilP